jgi:trehalose 6-phosphate phosphatase
MTITLSSRVLEAAVFDLDGVVTRTARVHFAAWKQLFDDFLGRRPPRAGEDHRPFDEQDYRAHVDGKPRLDGVRAFLASRGVSLAEGTLADPPTADTVGALGKRKNALFLELLDRLGVEVDGAAVELVRALRAAGVRVGVATSSRNAPALLRRAGLDTLFEARVDGIVGAELGLRGKPHPDAVLECLRRLGASAPERALLVEDATSGVEAGKATGFGLVLGVDRGGNWLRLREAGADWVVRGLGELSVEGLARYLKAREHVRPNALHAWPAIAKVLRGHRLAVFLDYDGTLTPIVTRPELAALDDGMRRTLRRLAGAWPTHVISGREVQDVRRRVGIDSLWMAGSHGFDIAPPRGVSGGKQVAPEVEPEVHRAADEVRRNTAAIPGVLVEDKRFSIAVHYRLVEEESVPAVERAVDDAVAHHPGLRKSHGKKVFDLQPALDWDKGKALRWLLDVTGQREAFPIYLGDDTTDEGAFAVLVERGLGILVTELPRPTAARYALQNPFEVQMFLERLASFGSEVPR